jgi:hypothetical protein
LSGLELYQNFPNPFAVRTVIVFELDKTAEVSLVVYDIRGRQVGQVLEGKLLAAGRYRVSISGDGLSPGVYYYRLTAGDRVRTRRMVLVGAS